MGGYYRYTKEGRGYSVQKRLGVEYCFDMLYRSPLEVIESDNKKGANKSIIIMCYVCIVQNQLDEEIQHLDSYKNCHLGENFEYE